MYLKKAKPFFNNNDSAEKCSLLSRLNSCLRKFHRANKIKFLGEISQFSLFGKHLTIEKMTQFSSLSINIFFLTKKKLKIEDILKCWNGNNNIFKILHENTVLNDNNKKKVTKNVRIQYKISDNIDPFRLINNTGISLALLKLRYDIN